MLIINDATYGGFGNKVFRINTLVQLGALGRHKVVSRGMRDLIYTFENAKYWFDNFPDYQFEHASQDLIYYNRKDITDYFRQRHNQIFDIPFPLCDLFYTIHKLDTHKLFRYKQELLDKHLSVDEKSVGIHIRANDRAQYSPPLNYYISAIEFVLKRHNNRKFIVFCDDHYCDLFKNVLEFLKTNNIDYTWALRQQTPNFINMSYCPILICPNSTFSICAGFCGQPKDIIHYKDYVLKGYEDKNPFWTKFLYGGMVNYRLYNIL